MKKLQFTKMHGLGNDFIVIDATQKTFPLTPDHIRQLAHRNFGIGFDQLLVLEASNGNGVDFNYRIFNADGAEVDQCGNGARCLALFAKAKGLTQKDELIVQTQARKMQLSIQDDSLVTVDMGVPHFNAIDIDIEAVNKLDVVFSAALLDTLAPNFADLGNPHMVFNVSNLEAIDIKTIANKVNQLEAFSHGANIGFMQIIDSKNIKLRVFERGSGETLACGSGACAAVVIGIQNGLLDSTVKVQLAGGELKIQWDGADNPILMTGPATTVFEGVIEL